MNRMKGREDNPHDVIQDYDSWIIWELNKGRGSFEELRDLVRRYKLYYNLASDPLTPEGTLPAWKYLLKVEAYF